MRYLISLIMLLCGESAVAQDDLRFQDIVLSLSVKNSLRPTVYEAKVDLRDSVKTCFDATTADSLVFNDLNFSFLAKKFDSGSKFMNSQLRQAMEVKKHPKVSIEILKLVQETNNTYQTTCNITIKNITQKVTFTSTKSRVEGSVFLEGKTTLFLPNFNIDVKNIGFGIVKVDKYAYTNFKLRLKSAEILASSLTK